MAGPMGYFNYVDDAGATYVIKLDASNASAVGATGASPPQTLPKRTKPRYVLARHPTTGRERRITVPDPANAVWTGTGGTLGLPDFAAGMASAAHQIMGRIGERRLA